VTIVSLRHLTRYRYAQPVALGEHRVMVRPLESYDQRLLEAALTISPAPSKLRWVQDVFGNSVALALFEGRTRELTFDSSFVMDHVPIGHEEIRVETYARRYPFTYSSEDMPDLARSIERGHHDPHRVIDQWARRFVRTRGRTDTLGMLVEMNSAIHSEFTYLARYQKGTQTPVETLERGQGSCRDFAVLMIEAARSLGLAARFVSGYFYFPDCAESVVAGGSTHAWVRVFLPGSGWAEFDPTNGVVGNRGLIRVGVTRDPYQAVPISGTWRGFPSDHLGMTVSVDVNRGATVAPPNVDLPPH
jgi:transglutaminase-like putative cysteine protease